MDGVKKLIRWLACIVAAGSFMVLAYAVFQTIMIDRAYNYGESVYEDAEMNFISPTTTATENKEIAPIIDSKEPSTVIIPTLPEPPKLIEPPFLVDFAALQAVNPDVVAWIYCEDTQINYPVLLGETNSKYLKKLYDGSYNEAGSIFMDYRNASDFSDKSTVLYGHNMKNGSRFHGINDFLSQEYFDEHTEWYVITEDVTYKFCPIAALITSYSDDLKLYQAISYNDENWADKMDDILSDARAKNSSIEVNAEDQLLMLSTCNYSFENARCVLLGKLIDQLPAD